MKGTRRNGKKQVDPALLSPQNTAEAPVFKITSWDGGESTDDRFTGWSFEDVLEEAKTDAIVYRGDVALFLGPEFQAAIQYRPNADKTFDVIFADPERAGAAIQAERPRRANRDALEFETRAAIGRWQEAVAHIRATDDDPAYDDDALNDLVGERVTQAEQQVIAMIYAWDSSLMRADVGESHHCHRLPRGVVVDGFLYVTAPADDGEALLMRNGEVEIDSPSSDGRATLQLVQVPVGSIVTLDGRKGGQS